MDSAKVTIEQVPVSTRIVVSGISDNTTHDAIELYFESRRYGGGPVERVEFTPKSGNAVVVFQDPKGLLHNSNLRLEFGYLLVAVE